MLALHAGSQGFDSHRGGGGGGGGSPGGGGGAGTCPNDFPDPVSSELENSKIVVSEWRLVIAVSLNIGRASALSNRQNCACAGKTLQTQ